MYVENKKEETTTGLYRFSTKYLKYLREKIVGDELYVCVSVFLNTIVLNLNLVRSTKISPQKGLKKEERQK